MADNDTEQELGGAMTPPPPAAEELQALPISGAKAPLDGSSAVPGASTSSVVRVDFQSGVRVDPAEAALRTPPAP